MTVFIPHVPREVAELEDKLTKEKEDAEKLHQSASQVSNKMFSESMSPAELAEWLLEELGNEFKDDINKLRSKRSLVLKVILLLYVYYIIKATKLMEVYFFNFHVKKKVHWQSLIFHSDLYVFSPAK